MATTSVGALSVQVGAEIRNLTVGLRKATTQVKTFSAKTRGYMQANADAINMVKRAFIGMGIAAAAGIGYAIKSFADLEEGYIEVAKRTGMAGKEMEDFKERLEALAMSMSGVSISELQEVAATAGQLGIQGEDNILTFTEAIAMMGVATNLSADEAALAMAKIVNVMGVDIKQTERLGSVMNELSNNTTATSSDISDLTRRMGGAGKTIGLTSAEIMALGATLVDTGTRLEVGGTAMSQIMQKMLTNTKGFAEGSGVALEEYTRMIETEPIEAVKALVSNLAGMQKFKRAEALKSLGLTGVRVAGTLMRLAGGTDILQENLRLANKEWERGTSLQTEYNIASRSMKAQFVRVKDAVMILAASIGEELRPEIMEAMRLFREFAESMSKDADMITTVGGQIATTMRESIKFIIGAVMAWNEMRIGLLHVSKAIIFIGIQYQKLQVLEAKLYAPEQVKERIEALRAWQQQMQRVIKRQEDNRDINWKLYKLRADLSKETKKSLGIEKESAEQTAESEKRATKAIKDKTNAIIDAGNAAKKAKDLTTEMIGGFGWKPPAISMGSGMGGIGGFATVGAGAGGKQVVLNQTIIVDNAREAGERTRQAVEETGAERN